MVVINFGEIKRLEEQDRLSEIFKMSELDLENKLNFLNQTFQKSLSKGLDLFLQTYEEFSKYFEINHNLDYFNPGLLADTINVLGEYYRIMPEHHKKFALTNIISFLNDENKGYTVFNHIYNPKLISDIILNNPDFFGSLVASQYELVFSELKSSTTFKEFYNSPSETDFVNENYNLGLQIIDNDFWLSYSIALEGLVSPEIQTKFFSEILKDTDELCDSIASFVFLDLIEDLSKCDLDNFDIYAYVDEILLPDYHFSLRPNIMKKFKEQNWTYLSTDTLPQFLQEELLIE